MAGLSSYYDELDDEFKNTKEGAGDAFDMTTFRRGGLTKDLYSLHQIVRRFSG